MKTWTILLALALQLAAWPALAQSPTCPDVPTGDVSNRCANTRFVSRAIGGGGTPLAQNKVFIGNAGGIATQATVGSDCTATLVGATAQWICTKTNGVAFGPFATSSSAANLTGTVANSNGGTGTGSVFTPGSVVFAGPGGAYTQDNAHLFWDNVSKRMGIATATPLSPLHVAGDADPGPGGWGNGQGMISGSSNPNQRLAFGYSTAADVGFIQPYINGSTYKPLLLNPGGGNVAIGGVIPLAQLHTTGGVRFAGLPGVGVSGCIGNDAAGNLSAGVSCGGGGGIGCVNVLSSGGNNTGTANNTPIINSILAGFSGAGGCIYYPPGNYRHDSSVVYSYPGGSAPFSIVITGAGPELSILNFPSSDGFNFHLAVASQNLGFEDVAITTDTIGTNIGLQADNASALGFGMHWGRNLLLRGNGASAFWGTAIRMFQLSSTNWWGVTIYGKFATPVSSGIGFVFDGPGGAFGDSIYNNISMAIMNSLGTGLVMGTHSQGITITQSNCQNTATCVTSPGGADVLQIQISDSQFDCQSTCISFTQALGATGGIFIHDNWIAPADSSNGVDMSQGVWVTIHNNLFACKQATPGVATANGIIVGGSDGSHKSANGTISGNIFQGCSAGVFLTANSTNFNVQANSYSATTTPVVNSAGGANQVGAATP